HLAARLGIGRRAVEDDLDLVALGRLAHALHAADPGQDARGRRPRLVRDEVHARDLAAQALVDRDALALLAGGERGARPRAVTLGLHLGVPGRVRLVVDDPAAVLEDVLGEITREPVRVVEREQEAAVHRAAAARALRGQVL